jgi:hypothetical protein
LPGPLENRPSKPKPPAFRELREVGGNGRFARVANGRQRSRLRLGRSRPGSLRCGLPGRSSRRRRSKHRARPTGGRPETTSHRDGCGPRCPPTRSRNAKVPSSWDSTNSSNGDSPIGSWTAPHWAAPPQSMAPRQTHVSPAPRHLPDAGITTIPDEYATGDDRASRARQGKACRTAANDRSLNECKPFGLCPQDIGRFHRRVERILILERRMTKSPGSRKHVRSDQVPRSSLIVGVKDRTSLAQARQWGRFRKETDSAAVATFLATGSSGILGASLGAELLMVRSITKVLTPLSVMWSTVDGMMLPVLW